MEDAVRGRVRELRTRGLTPKAIARALGLRPAEAAHMVRALAAEDQANAPERNASEREVVGCWVSPGWSHDLTLSPRPDEWPDVTDPPEGFAGLASVLVARRQRHDMVSVCGYLVDTHCLGVKNAMGPQVMHERGLHRFTRNYFTAYLAPPLPAPLELAQHLVYGAVDYARGLGFEPHPDFEAAKAHLGEWSGPSTIGFGRNGKPFYLSGPHDNPTAVMRTLDRTVGRGNYDFMVAAPMGTGMPSDVWI